LTHAIVAIWEAIPALCESRLVLGITKDDDGNRIFRIAGNPHIEACDPRIMEAKTLAQVLSGYGFSEEHINGIFEIIRESSIKFYSKDGENWIDFDIKLEMPSVDPKLKKEVEALRDLPVPNWYVVHETPFDKSKNKYEDWFYGADLSELKKCEGMEVQQLVEHVTKDDYKAVVDAASDFNAGTLLYYISKADWDSMLFLQAIRLGFEQRRSFRESLLIKGFNPQSLTSHLRETEIEGEIMERVKVALKKREMAYKPNQNK
jgi:hypothetical protein